MSENPFDAPQDAPQDAPHGVPREPDSVGTVPAHTLTDNFWLRIVTLCSLYVAQGLPFGFVTTALKNYLHGRGVSIADTGAMVAMISWPWAVKFLWGPIIDWVGIRSMGRRRPWLILAQGGAAITLFVLAFVPGLGDDVRSLGWAILLVNIFLSLQDVAADALAVDLLDERERGKVNGFMYGSSYLGTFLGGAVIGYFLTRDGGSIRVAMLMLGTFISLIMLLPLFIRERAGEKLLPWSKGSAQSLSDASGEESFGGFGDLLSAFRRPVAIMAAVFAMLLFIANGMLVIVGSEYFVNDLGWSDDAYTGLESIGIWFSLFGSIAGGFIADRIGAKKTVLVSGILLAVTWLLFSFAPVLRTSTWFVGGFIFSQAVFLGLMTVASFSMFMGIADKRVAATQFTTYMAILNLSTGIGGRIAGWANERLPDISNIYLVAGIFHLAVMAFVLLCVHPREKSSNDQPHTRQ